MVKDTRGKLAVILAVDAVGYSRLMGEIANFKMCPSPTPARTSQSSGHYMDV